MNADHPSRQQLAAFDAGCLPAEEREAVERHVAECPSCCGALETLPEDSLAAMIRAYSSHPAGACGPPTGSPTGWSVPAGLVGHPRYRVLGEVGRGGMGVVYKAIQLHMDRVVALEIIHPGLLGRPGLVERFRQEVRAVGRLDHEHIATAHDADGAGGLHFLVMEFVAGESLE